MPHLEKAEAAPHRMLSEVAHKKLRTGHYSHRTEQSQMNTDEHR